MRASYGAFHWKGRVAESSLKTSYVLGSFDVDFI